MQVKRLIEELQKLPANVLEQEAVVKLAYDRRVVEGITWTGGYVLIETGGRSA